MLQYADDLKIYSRVQGPELCNELQMVLNRISAWAKENKLTINPAKAIFVRNKKSLNTSRSYVIDGMTILQSDYVKDLGVVFDADFNSKKQYHEVTARVIVLFYAARRFCKEKHNQSLILKIFYTYILPVAEYCRPVWARNRINLNEGIEWVLRETTRFALGIARQPFQDNYVCQLQGTLHALSI